MTANACGIVGIVKNHKYYFHTVSSIDYDKLADEYKGLSAEQINERIRLTKDWIGIMLFTGGKTTDELIRHGCKVMVYGHPYEVFLKILEGMLEDGTINIAAGNYGLEQKGLFEVKRKSIVPLLNLIDNPEYTSSFIETNKSNCDTEFIHSLEIIRNEEQQEQGILQYGEKHYDKLAPIINLINTFFENLSKSPPPA